MVPGTPEWQGLRSGVKIVARQIGKTRPDTLILLTGERRQKAVAQAPKARLAGCWRDPAFAGLGEIDLRARQDMPLIDALTEAGVPVRQARDNAALASGGAVIAALEAAVPGPAEVLGYGAIFGAGAAVTHQRTEGRT